MVINNIKDLEAVLKLCHKQGVHSIEVDNIKMVIGEPPTPKLKSEEPKEDNTAQLSEEDLLLWSVNNHGA